MTAPRIAVKTTLEGDEAQEWKKIKDKRFARGKDILQRGGATQLEGHGTVFVLQKSIFDRGVEFYFDREAGRWFVGIGAVAPSDTIRWKSALSGRDPSTFRVWGMAWGNSKVYNDVIEDLESANEVGK